MTVTNGILDGTGSISTVTVSDGTGGIVTNGDGTTSALTIGSLTFNGVGTMNPNMLASAPNSPAIITNTLLASGAAGTVTINPTAPNWLSGNAYKMVKYDGLLSNFAAYTLGTVPGLNPRQTATLGKDETGASSYLTLNISGVDYIKWTGARISNWTTTTPGNTNWVLGDAGAATDFLTNDAVLFTDSGSNKSIEITDASVSPVSMTFNNGAGAANSYTISSTVGGYGIATGYLVKSGTGEVTINTANAYAGGTTLNAGKLNVNTATALGTGPVTINGGTLGNTSAGAVILSTNNTQAWNGSFSFAGPQDLDMGTGAVSLNASLTVTADAGTLAVGALSSAAADLNLTKAGTGNLSLGGNSTISGQLNVSAGKLLVRGDLTAVKGFVGTGTIENGNADVAGNDRWVYVQNIDPVTFDGIITGGVNNKLGFNKTGAGTFTFTNSGNKIDDAVTVQQGTLNFVGTHTNTTQVDQVGTLAGFNAILNIGTGATFNANWARNGWESSLEAGTTGNSAGSIRVNGGTVNTASQLAIGTAWHDASYAAYTQTAGTVTVGGFLAVGGTAGGGAFNLSGGTFTKSGWPCTVGFGNTGIGVINLSGDSVFTSAQGGDGLWLAENGSTTAVLNMSDNAQLNIRTSANLAGGGGLSLGMAGTAKGIVNLLGNATITTPFVEKRVADAGSYWYL